MSKDINIGLVQQVLCNDPDKNLTDSINGIKQAASDGARIVVLSELHRSLYFCQNEDTRNFDLAESIPGPTTDVLSDLSKKLSIIIVASLFEKRAAGLYHNTAVVLDTDGSLAGRYRKMHIPDDPGYYEKFYFTPGDLGFEPIQTSLARIGVLVCWDQWYPEAARLMALAGAELIVIPTAIGWDSNDSQEEQQRQRDAWITVQRAHAIANGLPVVVCNRTGIETDPQQQTGGIHFWGSSFVAGQQGEMMAQCPVDAAQTLTVSVNIDRNDQVRRIWPFFRDRRTDAYHDIVKRYRD